MQIEVRNDIQLANATLFCNHSVTNHYSPLIEKNGIVMVMVIVFLMVNVNA